MNSIQGTSKQQIDETIESLKALFLSQARSLQEADEIRCRLNSLGHEAKQGQGRVTFAIVME